MTAANAETPARFAHPPDRIDVRVQRGGAAVDVRPIGELDLSGSRRLSTAIHELVEALDILPFDRQQT